MTMQNIKLIPRSGIPKFYILIFTFSILFSSHLLLYAENSTILYPPAIYWQPAPPTQSPPDYFCFLKFLQSPARPNLWRFVSDSNPSGKNSSESRLQPETPCLALREGLHIALKSQTLGSKFFL